MCLCVRKSPYALHPVSQKFPERCLWNGSTVRLTDDDPLSSFQGRSSSASSFNASFLQATNGVMSLALCPQVVSQASQKFRSSEKQGTSEGCFARQSICCVVFPHSGMSTDDDPQEFSKVDIDHRHSGLVLRSRPFHFSLFLASSLNLWGWWHVWFDCHLLWQSSGGMGNCFHLYCEAVGWDHIGCTGFMDGSLTLLDSEAPPWLVFGDWAISVHCEVLRFAVFLNEKLDLWLCFACWPFSTVLSQVFWQECLVETPESVWVPFPLLGLLELCQQAYLQYWVLCETHPRLAPSQSASLCVFHGFVEWVVGISTALKYVLTCSTFCLVCIGGYLAWTSWSQWACPWWFRVWIALPRSALCPALADLSVPSWGLMTLTIHKYKRTNLTLLNGDGVFCVARVCSPRNTADEITPLTPRTPTDAINQYVRVFTSSRFGCSRTVPCHVFIEAHWPAQRVKELE